MKTSIALLVLVALVAGCGGDQSPKMQNGSPTASTPAAAAKAPDENAALDAIAKINEAQSNYFKRNRRYALTFDELTAARLLNSEPTTAQTGYEFKLRPAADAQAYKLSVDPAVLSAAARHFFTDESAAIHAETGKDATVDSPKI